MFSVFVCFISFAVFSTGYCTVTGWSSPADTDANMHGGTVYMADTDTGPIYTFTPTVTGATITSIAMQSQTVNSFFEFVSATNGIMTLATNNFLDSSSSTTEHVLSILATDSTGATGVVTLTIKVEKSAFQYADVCINFNPSSATGTAVITNTVSAQDPRTYSIISGNTNTDFDIGPSTGVVSLANTLTSTSGSSYGRYTLTITGAENIGTASTATARIEICLYDRYCKCYSSSVVITAGIVSFAGLCIVMLEKYT